MSDVSNRTELLNQLRVALPPQEFEKTDWATLSDAELSEKLREALSSSNKMTIGDSFTLGESWVATPEILTKPPEPKPFSVQKLIEEQVPIEQRIPQLTQRVAQQMAIDNLSAINQEFYNEILSNDKNDSKVSNLIIIENDGIGFLQKSISPEGLTWNEYRGGLINAIKNMLKNINPDMDETKIKLDERLNSLSVKQLKEFQDRFVTESDIGNVLFDLKSATETYTTTLTSNGPHDLNHSSTQTTPTINKPLEMPNGDVLISFEEVFAIERKMNFSPEKIRQYMIDGTVTLYTDLYEDGFDLEKIENYSKYASRYPASYVKAFGQPYREQYLSILENSDYDIGGFGLYKAKLNSNLELDETGAEYLIPSRDLTQHVETRELDEGELKHFAADMLYNMINTAYTMLKGYYDGLWDQLKHGSVGGAAVQGMLAIGIKWNPATMLANAAGADINVTILDQVNKMGDLLGKAIQLKNMSGTEFDRNFEALYKELTNGSDFNPEALQKLAQLSMKGMKNDADTYKSALKEAFGVDYEKNADTEFSILDPINGVVDIIAFLAGSELIGGTKLFTQLGMKSVQMLGQTGGRIFMGSVSMMAYTGATEGTAFVINEGYNLYKGNTEGFEDRAAEFGIDMLKQGAMGAASVPIGAVAGKVAQTVSKLLSKEAPTAVNKAFSILSKTEEKSAQEVIQNYYKAMNGQSIAKAEETIAEGVREFLKNAPANVSGFLTEVGGFTVYSTTEEIIEGLLRGNLDLENIDLGEEFLAQIQGLGTIKGIARFIQMKKAGNMANPVMDKMTEKLKDYKIKNGQDGKVEITNLKGEKKTFNTPDDALEFLFNEMFLTTGSKTPSSSEKTTSSSERTTVAPTSEIVDLVQTELGNLSQFKRVKDMDPEYFEEKMTLFTDIISSKSNNNAEIAKTYIETLKNSRNIVDIVSVCENVKQGAFILDNAPVVEEIVQNINKTMGWRAFSVTEALTEKNITEILELSRKVAQGDKEAVDNIFYTIYSKEPHDVKLSNDFVEVDTEQLMYFISGRESNDDLKFDTEIAKLFSSHVDMMEKKAYTKAIYGVLKQHPELFDIALESRGQKTGDFLQHLRDLFNSNRLPKTLKLRTFEPSTNGLESSVVLGAYAHMKKNGIVDVSSKKTTTDGAVVADPTAPINPAKSSNDRLLQSFGVHDVLKPEELKTENKDLLTLVKKGDKSKGEKDKYKLTKEADEMIWKVSRQIREAAMKNEPEIISIMRELGLVSDAEHTIFKDAEGNPIDISHRSKSEQSLHDKIQNALIEKMQKGESISLEDAILDVRDGVGCRTANVVKNYANEPDVKAAVERGDTKTAIDLAVEHESKQVYDALIKYIDSVSDGTNKVELTRIANYIGEDGIPYFTERQLNQLQAYADSKNVKLPIIERVKTLAERLESKTDNVYDEHSSTKVRGSGYTALQMNFRVKETGFVYEWQYRGQLVNEFGEAEHVPYDLRTGKDIVGQNKELESLYKPMQKLLSKENMTKERYQEYENYLSAHYEYLRLKELGFDKEAGDPPKLPQGLDARLRAENLILLHEYAEKIKKEPAKQKELLAEYESKLVQNTAENTTSVSYTEAAAAKQGDRTVTRYEASRRIGENNGVNNGKYSSLVVKACRDNGTGEIRENLLKHAETLQSLGVEDRIIARIITKTKNGQLESVAEMINDFKAKHPEYSANKIAGFMELAAGADGFINGAKFDNVVKFAKETRAEYDILSHIYEKIDNAPNEKIAGNIKDMARTLAQSYTASTMGEMKNSDSFNDIFDACFDKSGKIDNATFEIADALLKCKVDFSQIPQTLSLAKNSDDGKIWAVKKFITDIIQETNNFQNTDMAKTRGNLTALNEMLKSIRVAKQTSKGVIWYPNIGQLNYLTEIADKIIKPGGDKYRALFNASNVLMGSKMNGGRINNSSVKNGIKLLNMGFTPSSVKETLGLISTGKMPELGNKINTICNKYPLGQDYLSVDFTVEDGLIKRTVVLKDKTVKIEDFDANTLEKAGEYTLERGQYANHPDVKVTETDDIIRGKRTRVKREGGTPFEETTVIKDPTTGETIGIEYIRESADIEGGFDIQYRDTRAGGVTTTLSEARVDEFGNKTVRKDYDSLDGTNTKYDYKETPDGSYSSHNVITDNTGKVLLDEVRTFTVIDGTHCESTYNGKKYFIEITEDNLLTVTREDGEKVSYDLDEFSKENMNNPNFVELFKHIPGHEFFQMQKTGTSNVQRANVKGNANYNPANNNVNLGTGHQRLSTFLHEFGHNKDYKLMENALREDSELLELYEEERQAFVKAFPSMQREFVNYFIGLDKQGDRQNRGIAEVIAEANLLLNNQNGAHPFRGEYLRRYFPKTIAHVAKFLNPEAYEIASFAGNKPVLDQIETFKTKYPNLNENEIAGLVKKAIKEDGTIDQNKMDDLVNIYSLTGVTNERLEQTYDFNSKLKKLDGLNENEKNEILTIYQENPDMVDFLVNYTEKVGVLDIHPFKNPEILKSIVEYANTSEKHAELVKKYAPKHQILSDIKAMVESALKNEKLTEELDNQTIDLFGIEFNRFSTDEIQTFLDLVEKNPDIYEKVINTKYDGAGVVDYAKALVINEAKTNELLSEKVINEDGTESQKYTIEQVRRLVEAHSQNPAIVDKYLAQDMKAEDITNMAVAEVLSPEMTEYLSEQQLFTYGQGWSKRFSSAEICDMVQKFKDSPDMIKRYTEMYIEQGNTADTRFKTAKEITDVAEATRINPELTEQLLNTPIGKRIGKDVYFTSDKIATVVKISQYSKELSDYLIRKPNFDNIEIEKLLTVVEKSPEQAHYIKDILEAIDSNNSYRYQLSDFKTLYEQVLKNPEFTLKLLNNKDNVYSMDEIVELVAKNTIQDQYSLLLDLGFKKRDIKKQLKDKDSKTLENLYLNPGVRDIIRANRPDDTVEARLNAPYQEGVYQYLNVSLKGGKVKVDFKMNENNEPVILSKETIQKFNGKEIITKTFSDGSRIVEEMMSYKREEFDAISALHGYKKTHFNSDGIQTYSEVMKPGDVKGEYTLVAFERGQNGFVRRDLGTVKTYGSQNQGQRMERTFENRDGLQSHQLRMSGPKGSSSEYRISDKNGNTLFETKRRVYQVSDNVYRSEVNGQKYETVFDGTDVTVHRLNENGEITETIKFGSDDLAPELKQIYTQMTGADFFRLKEAGTKVLFGGHADENNACFYLPDNTISISPELKNSTFTFFHEFGHAMDFVLFGDSNLSDDPKLQEIFQRELAAYKSVTTDTEGHSIDYFTGRHRNRDGNTLDEIIAEANALVSGTLKSENNLGMRSEELNHHFIETLSYIANALKNPKQYIAERPQSGSARVEAPESQTVSKLTNSGETVVGTTYSATSVEFRNKLSGMNNYQLYEIDSLVQLYEQHGEIVEDMLNQKNTDGSPRFEYHHILLNLNAKNKDFRLDILSATERDADGNEVYKFSVADVFHENKKLKDHPMRAEIEQFISDNLIHKDNINSAKFRIFIDLIDMNTSLEDLKVFERILKDSKISSENYASNIERYKNLSPEQKAEVQRKALENSNQGIEKILDEVTGGGVNPTETIDSIIKSTPEFRDLPSYVFEEIREECTLSQLKEGIENLRLYLKNKPDALPITKANVLLFKSVYENRGLDLDLKTIIENGLFEKFSALYGMLDVKGVILPGEKQFIKLQAMSQISCNNPKIFNKNLSYIMQHDIYSPKEVAEIMKYDIDYGKREAELKDLDVDNETRAILQKTENISDISGIKRTIENLRKRSVSIDSVSDIADVLNKIGIKDYESFNRYIENINFDEVTKIAPRIAKFNGKELLTFFAFHYKKGTTDFNSSTLSFSKDFTNFLASNYVDAENMGDILAAYPMTSRDVGELPEGWLTEPSSDKKELINLAIDTFRNSGSISGLERSLASVLNKKVTIKELGSGVYGTGYKIDVEGSTPVVLKLFHDRPQTSAPHEKHGKGIETQTGIFLNNNSNKFVHIYFGRICGSADSDGFLVTQYMGDGVTPLITAGNNSKYIIDPKDVDDKGHNKINDMIIDFGLVNIKNADDNSRASFSLFKKKPQK